MCSSAVHHQNSTIHRSVITTAATPASNPAALIALLCEPAPVLELDGAGLEVDGGDVAELEMAVEKPDEPVVALPVGRDTELTPPTITVDATLVDGTDIAEELDTRVTDDDAPAGVVAAAVMDGQVLEPEESPFYLFFRENLRLNNEKLTIK